jgi:type 1 glutamine amidotransferase
MKAKLFCGGWEGHHPEAFRAWAADLLTAEGFEVDSHDTLAPLAHRDAMQDVDLIVPIWSSARSAHRPEFGNMTKAQEDGLIAAIANGAGISSSAASSSLIRRDGRTTPSRPTISWTTT